MWASANLTWLGLASASSRAPRNSATSTQQRRALAAVRKLRTSAPTQGSSFAEPLYAAIALAYSTKRSRLGHGVSLTTITGQSRRAAMTDRKFIIHKAGDSTREAVLRNATAALAALDGKEAWAVTIKRYRKPRTSVANAYLWGVVYATMVRELGFCAEDWHEEMCIRYFGKVETPKPSGTVTTPWRTTTTDEMGERDVLSGAPFWDFIEFVRRQAAEAGVYCPEPNERDRDAD